MDATVPRTLFRFLSRLTVVSLLLAGTLRADAPPTSSPADGVRIMGQTTLDFSAGGHPLPVPVVNAELYGTRGLLIVDTGSSHNAIARAWADERKFGQTPPASGRDHAGTAMTVAVAPPGKWQIGATSRTLDDTVITPTPAAFAPLGIVGFLSPQNFFEHGFVVLDFAAGRLTVLEGSPPAVEAWLRPQNPRARLTALARERGIDPRKIFVRARLPGRDPVVAEIDTGGSFTEFDDNLLPASDPTEVATSLSVTGKKASARLVAGQTVILGELSFGPMKVKARAPIAGFAALIGMDLLRRTVVVIPPGQDAPLLLLQSQPE